MEGKNFPVFAVGWKKAKRGQEKSGIGSSIDSALLVASGGGESASMADASREEITAYLSRGGGRDEDLDSDSIDSGARDGRGRRDG
jgi:hypothetical protein